MPPPEARGLDVLQQTCSQKRWKGRALLLSLRPAPRWSPHRCGRLLPFLGTRRLSQSRTAEAPRHLRSPAERCERPLPRLRIQEQLERVGTRPRPQRSSSLRLPVLRIVGLQWCNLSLVPVPTGRVSHAPAAAGSGAPHRGPPTAPPAKRLNKAPAAVDTHVMSRDTYKCDETITLSALITEVLRERADDPTLRPLVCAGRIPSERGCRLVPNRGVAAKEGF